MMMSRTFSSKSFATPYAFGSDEKEYWVLAMQTGKWALYYVDLPGYGYAKVALEAKEKWGKMIERYLKNSSMLKMVFLLVDIRHEPSANDKMMYDWIIYNGYHPVIIATKLDKINRSQIQKHVKMIRQGLGMEKEGILIPFSAETKQGRDEIWDLIESNL